MEHRGVSSNHCRLSEESETLEEVHKVLETSEEVGRHWRRFVKRRKRRRRSEDIGTSEKHQKTSETSEMGISEMVQEGWNMVRDSIFPLGPNPGVLVSC